MKTNAKKELKDILEDGDKLVAAEIIYKYDYGSELRITLRTGYNEEDFACFMEKLNFEYDSEYGRQYVFGTLWFEDYWVTREEYAGSEWWEAHIRPSMPTDLL